MTDNAKKALEFLKDNKEVLERFKKVKDVKEVFELSKEYKLDLTEEDLGIVGEKKEFLEGKRKMDINELAKISGAGDFCLCIAGGGGELKSTTCFCAVWGVGMYEKGEIEVVCKCVFAGSGDEDQAGSC